jgi:hypothetical protein
MQRTWFIPFFLLCVSFALNGCFWAETEDHPDYLPLDDSEYPYAGLPRIVIETEDFARIRDRETLHPSHLQIYGESEPESEVLELTVRGRGNSSFKMPKFGMKLEFSDKVSLFGMPKNRDWALVGNFGDKTHLRNYMALRLSEWLGASYTPKVHFVELYLNREYKGLYLLAESIKVGKNRVNIPENDSSFLFEKEGDKKYDDPYIVTNEDNIYHIKSPKNLSEASRNMLLDHLNNFEFYLGSSGWKDSNLSEWVDLNDFALFYWVQEFSKNEDGNFARSIFMTWEKGGPIHFGPVWDFDLSFGNESREDVKPSSLWYIRNYSWYAKIFWVPGVKDMMNDYWTLNREKFRALIDSVPVYRAIIEKALENEYKRWPVIRNTENWALKDPYDSYDEAVEYMVQWMRERYDWIESHL